MILRISFLLTLEILASTTAFHTRQSQSIRRHNHHFSNAIQETMTKRSSPSTIGLTFTKHHRGLHHRTSRRRAVDHNRISTDLHYIPRDADYGEILAGGQRYEMVELPDSMVDTTLFVGNLCEVRTKIKENQECHYHWSMEIFFLHCHDIFLPMNHYCFPL